MADSIKLPIDNTPIHELVKYLNEMKAALKEVKEETAIAEINSDIEKTNELLKKQIEEYDTTGKSVQDLRKDFKYLKDQLSEATDPEEVAKLAKATGTVRDKMKDLNEQIAVFATGSKFEQMSTSLGQIKGDLMNMDFEGASEKAQVLTKMVQGISFKEATAGLKNLGTTFMNLGKALLANPLFLLATVIVAIVLALKELMDAIGVTQAIMNVFGKVMKAIGDILNTFIVEPLKAVADWLGITSNAADEAADKEVAAAEKKKAAYQDAHNTTINALENEIKIRKAAGEDTSKLEAKLLKEKKDAVADEIEQTRRALKAKEDKLKNSKQLTEEEVETLKKETTELRTKIKADKLSYNNAIGDIKAFYAAKKKERADEKDKEKEDAKKAEEEAAEEAKAAAERAAARRKKIAETKLAVERQLIDLGLAIMVEGQNKEIAILNEGYRRQLEDIKKNEDYTAAQKLALTTALEEKQGYEISKIKDKYAKLDEQRAIDTINRVKKYQDDRYAQDRKNRQTETADILTKLDEQRDAKILSLQLASMLDKDNLDKKIALLEAEKDKEIEVSMATGDAKKMIELKYAEEIQALKDQQLQNTIASVMAIEQAGTAILSAFASFKQDSLDKEQKALDAKHEKELAGLEEGSAAYKAAKERQAKEDDMLARKAFESNKKMQLGTAIMNAAMGVTSIIAQYPKFDGGIAMAAALIATAATNAAAIAKIASTKYESSNTGTINTNGVSTSSTPSINLFGNPNNANTVNASNNQPVNVNNQVVVKAYVSETDITDSQRRVARYQNSATL